MWLRDLLHSPSPEEAAPGASKVRPPRKHAPLASKVKVPRDRFGSAHAILREGWLYKKGGSHGGRTNWKRRWFILSPSGLYYFESQQATHSIGVVMLLAETLALLTDRTERANSFAIMAPEMDPFYLAATDDEERLRWMEAIYTTCTSRGYRESEQDSKRRRSSLDGGPSGKATPPLSPRALGRGSNSAPTDVRHASASPGCWVRASASDATVGERHTRPTSASVGERPLPSWIDLLGPSAKLEAILERNESDSREFASSQSRSSLRHESGSKRRRSSLEVQRPRAATIG